MTNDQGMFACDTCVEEEEEANETRNIIKCSNVIPISQFTDCKQQYSIVFD